MPPLHGPEITVQNDAGTGRLGVGLCPGNGSVTGGGSGMWAWWPTLLPGVERERHSAGCNR